MWRIANRLNSAVTVQALDTHEGDFEGFAKLKGWASVKTEHRAGRAVRVVSTK